MARAPVFSHNKGNRVRFMKLVRKKVYPLRHGASFYPFLFSNHLQKVRNLQIGVNKLVRKVSINLLHHAKSATYVISIIIYAPYSYAVEVVHPNKLI